MYQVENLILSNTVSLTLSHLLAQRFCPIIGHIAPESANITANATGDTLQTILIPATAESQNDAIDLVTYAFPIGVARFVSTAGRAISIIGQRYADIP